VTAAGGAPNFAALFEESLKSNDMRVGEVISAEVVRIEFNHVVVNAGLKSESYVPIDEFKNDQGELEVQVGDFVSVAIDAVENGYGDTILSRDKAKRLASWMSLENSLESGDFVTGTVSGKVKGGLTGPRQRHPRLPPGLAARHAPVKDMSPFEGKTMEFKVIKLDRKRNNVVLSRRAVVEASMGEERAKLLETLTEGAIVHGVVKNITEYGAFVDLGGIDGLLHITDMAWRRGAPPERGRPGGPGADREGAEVRRREEPRLARHQAARRRPVARRQPPLPDRHAPLRQGHEHRRLRRVRRDRARHRGPRPRLRDGLDEQERRPVEGRHARRGGRGHGPRDRRGQAPHQPRHEAVQGEPVGGVQRQREARRQGQGPGQVDHRLRRLRRPVGGHRRPRPPVRPVVARAGRDRGPQLQEGPGRSRPSCWRSTSSASASASASSSSDVDPFTSFTTLNDRGAIVTGKVKAVDPRGAEIQLNDDVTGYLRASEISRDRVEDARNVLKEGDDVSVMIINVDRKLRSIQLSIKAKDNADQQEAMQRLSQSNERETAGTTSLGALLRAKLDTQKE
jgi:predicted RNA-binding protein with RPS1 domain